MNAVGRVNLHVGLHKTGTTTIQSAMTKHRERLAEIGILYLMFRRAAIASSPDVTAAEERSEDLQIESAGDVAWPLGCAFYDVHVDQPQGIEPLNGISVRCRRIAVPTDVVGWRDGRHPNTDPITTAGSDHGSAATFSNRRARFSRDRP